ncbi:hypothetical protein B0H67DRAFT_551757 [Lasiosphaeris hirsuta]|uniref:Uncharacterized protein n=1 Tax=Lasiosphaeris hirsuta TaxID=260670 RepID=A0AA40AP14_9PEZI|nr:hypothetical protein B0H67DRAFT_551757 [Lasiosphaeris hirsuta]
MKFPVLALTAFVARLAVADSRPADTGTDAAAFDFEKVKLSKPLNWSPGRTLSRERINFYYGEPLHKYDAESWADYVLKKCKTDDKDDCYSTISYQATNSGSPKYRLWFGVTFRAAASEKDLERNKDVTDSIVYSIKRLGLQGSSEDEADGQIVVDL